MGRTPKPLRILILYPLTQWEEFKTLEAQGHHVTFAVAVEDDADLILGAQAWHMTDAERQYLPLAIKAARKRRYGKAEDDPPPSPS